MILQLVKGDITTVAVDAIVNAANTSLLGGGGVDGAIHRKGGKEILEACMAIRNKQGGCLVGQAVITTAGLLPTKYVIHTVGPVWNGGKKEEDELLSACYANSLALAAKYEVRSIAFPNISTGIYHFPKKRAAKIALQAIQQCKDKEELEKILFVCFDEENYSIYKELLSQ